MIALIENIHGDFLEISNVSQIKHGGGMVYIYHQKPESRFESVQIVPHWVVKQITLKMLE